MSDASKQRSRAPIGKPKRGSPSTSGAEQIQRGDPVYDPPAPDHSEFRSEWAKRLERGTTDTVGYGSTLARTKR